jgi:hypothetical protein
MFSRISCNRLWLEFMHYFTLRVFCSPECRKSPRFVSWLGYSKNLLERSCCDLPIVNHVAVFYFYFFSTVPLGPLSFGIFTAICVLCFPVALTKTVISLVQLYAACQNVVAIDIADRERAALEETKNK